MGWGEGVWFRGPGFWGGFWDFGTPDPGASGSGAQSAVFTVPAMGLCFSGQIAGGRHHHRPAAAVKLKVPMMLELELELVEELKPKLMTQVTIPRPSF